MKRNKHTLSLKLDLPYAYNKKNMYYSLPPEIELFPFWYFINKYLLYLWLNFFKRYPYDMLNF